MNRIVTVTVLASAIIALQTNVGFADQRAKPGPMKTVTRNLNPMNWRMPKLKMPSFKKGVPQQQERTRIRKKKNGFMTDVRTSASNGWNKTKETLSPARFFPASAKSPATQEKKEPGFLRSMFAPRPEPRRPESVTDFLAGQKPGT